MGRELLQHESDWLMGEIIPPAASVPVQTVRHRVPPAGRREKCFKLPIRQAQRRTWLTPNDSPGPW